MEQWKLQSTELRRELNKDLPFSADNAESAGLFDPHVQIIELKFKSSTAFDALEHVGRAYKSVSGLVRSQNRFKSRFLKKNNSAEKPATRFKRKGSDQAC